jgi:hypothetical protein
MPLRKSSKNNAKRIFIVCPRVEVRSGRKIEELFLISSINNAVPDKLFLQMQLRPVGQAS